MRALLSFFTVVPLGPRPLDEAARSVYALPLVGLVTGAPAALVLLWGGLPDGLCAVLALSLCLIASGLHHADGVLDAGDAFMVRGDPPRRREVLADTRVGIGGIFALFLVYAPALAALSTLAASPRAAALALLASEAAARSVMVLMMTFGTAATRGSSVVPFVEALAGRRRVAAVALALLVPPVVLLPYGALAGLPGLVVAVLTVLSLTASRQAFGGLTGDLVGASGEAARTVVLVLLAATVGPPG